MIKELTHSIHKLISSGVHYEVGSIQYFIVLGVGVAAWLVMARVFMRLYKSEKGIFGALLALVFPLVLGLLTYGLVDSKVVPLIEAQWSRQYLPLAALVVVSLLVILLVSKRFIKLGGVVTLIIFVCSSVVAVGVFYGAMITLETIEQGRDQLQEREERNKQEIESVM